MNSKWADARNDPERNKEILQKYWTSPENIVKNNNVVYEEYGVHADDIVEELRFFFFPNDIDKKVLHDLNFHDIKLVDEWKTKGFFFIFFKKGRDEFCDFFMKNISSGSPIRVWLGLKVYTYGDGTKAVFVQNHKTTLQFERERKFRK